MNTQILLEKLGYKDSPAFLHGRGLEKHYGYSFFFSQASQDIDKNSRGCNLKGVYRVFDSSGNSTDNSITPVVYICEAVNEDDAGKIHKRVWNQNIVPFLFVVTPQNIRLYSGFDYNEEMSDEQQVLQVVRNVREILEKFSEFTTTSIDSGQIWQQQKISTVNRVDRHLLASLENLSDVLRGRNYDLPLEHAHSLIGKYIYLKYLRDRDILSDDRLSKFNMVVGDFLGRDAQKNKLYEIEEHLDVFLNGSVFPLPSKKDIEEKHIRKVAATFHGDDPENGQEALFDIYNFSCIPIETLSVVYQQFLHQKGDSKTKGAYYTPVHLVNFMLDELNAKTTFKKGMKVLDPSCGSGAFLVQCYRRMVEGVVRKRKKKLNPSDLRAILTENIFGLDADKEACQVAQLSLSLTLLDYIDPPDLTKTNFKLPDLRKSNIFYCEGGFFDENSIGIKIIEKIKYNLIVGNPPWKNINKNKNDKPYDIKAIEWINANKKLFPVDNYQTAEAFIWKVTKLLDIKGHCGFLMPAKTLSKKQGNHFRKEFFSKIETWCIVNFSNIRRYLFEGAINPAAAFFFSGKKDWDKTEHSISTYAPFAIEHSLQLNQNSKSKKLWSIFVNYSLIKNIPLKNIANGSAESWKIAMWGSQRDNLLIKKICKNKIFLNDFKKRGLSYSEGLQVREANKPNKNLELCNEIKGKKILLMNELKGRKGLYYFPKNVFGNLPQDHDIYVRKGRKEKPLKVCFPPHIFIDSARRFTIYSDDFFVIPPRQIGISGDVEHTNLIKSLALYFNSDFVCYHQWLTSASWGIERDTSNFDDLKRLPIPLSKLSNSELEEWAKLYDRIVEASRNKNKTLTRLDLFDSEEDSNDWSPSLDDILKEMNRKVFELLEISKKQQWLIKDMIDVRMKLNDGKIAKEATTQAKKDEINEFANIFQNELDLYLDETGKNKVHKVKVLYTDNTAVMIIEHLQKAKAEKPEIIEVKDNETKKEFDNLQAKLTEHRSQWIYYTRCLKIYDEFSPKTYIFKPRQRLYWLKSQALIEADDFLEAKIKGE
jgi:hypothetical protein